MMRVLTVIVTIWIFMPITVVGQSLTTAELVQATKKSRQQQQQHNIKREAEFKKQEQALRLQRDKLIAQKKELQLATDELSVTFSQNQKQLIELEKQQQTEAGTLNELTNTVKQTVKELDKEYEYTAIGLNQYHMMKEVNAHSSLPSISQLTQLWHLLTQQVQLSSMLTPISVMLIDRAGHRSEQTAYRLGSIALIGDQGLLDWDREKQAVTYYSYQPELLPSMTQLSHIKSGQMVMMNVDPSRGDVLTQLANSPTLLDRIQTAGVVGWIIILLLLIGFGIACFNGVRIFQFKRQINRQLHQLDKVSIDNPLGRILSVYHAEKMMSVEALELRLLEAVMDEQQALDKGLSMLKLLAAIAPMLGLLGTVTGMIETFQDITQFGNGDPKVMAGGISMALVTTVLGLVAAMPLLLMHNILSSQVENLRTMLEKQGLSLVAQQAEKQSVQSGMNIEQVIK